MNNEMSRPLPVELLAASLRNDTTDIHTMLDVLASKLSGSLPEQTQVIRERKLFKSGRVMEIIVTFGDARYTIAREPHNNVLRTMRSTIVHGVALKTDDLSLEQWIAALALSLSQASVQSAQFRDTLERFLLQ